MNVPKQRLAAAEFAGKSPAVDAAVNELVEGICLFKIGELVPTRFQFADGAKDIK